jgi:hypothetical protein
VTAYYSCGYLGWQIGYLAVCEDWQRFTFGQLTFKKIRMASFLGCDCHGGMGLAGRAGAALAWKVPLADWFCLRFM